MFNPKKFKKLSRPKKICFSLIIGIGIISFWRGIWGLSDIYIFPSNEPLSFTISIALSLVLLISTGFFVREITG